MEFSRQEWKWIANWSGLPFPSPGDLPDSGMELGSRTLQADSLQSEPPGKSHIFLVILLCVTEEPGRLQSMGSLRVGHD